MKVMWPAGEMLSVNELVGAEQIIIDSIARHSGVLHGAVCSCGDDC